MKKNNYILIALIVLLLWFLLRRKKKNTSEPEKNTDTEEAKNTQQPDSNNNNNNNNNNNSPGITVKQQVLITNVVQPVKNPGTMQISLGAASSNVSKYSYEVRSNLNVLLTENTINSHKSTQFSVNVNSGISQVYVTITTYFTDGTNQANEQVISVLFANVPPPSPVVDDVEKIDITPEKPEPKIENSPVAISTVQQPNNFNKMFINLSKGSASVSKYKCEITTDTGELIFSQTNTPATTQLSFEVNRGVSQLYVTITTYFTDGSNQANERVISVLFTNVPPPSPVVDDVEKIDITPEKPQPKIEKSPVAISTVQQPASRPGTLVIYFTKGTGVKLVSLQITSSDGITKKSTFTPAENNFIKWENLSAGKVTVRIVSTYSDDSVGVSTKEIEVVYPPVKQVRPVIDDISRVPVNLEKQPVGIAPVVRDGVYVWDDIERKELGGVIKVY